MFNQPATSYSIVMARRYRRRKRRNEPEALLTLIILGVAALETRSGQRDGKLIIAVTFVSLGGLVVLALLVFGWRKQKERQRTKALTMADIATMDGLVFEQYVGKLLASQGYSGIRFTERYDLGVDIIARRNGIVWGVQVKRYSHVVKAAAVRQVVTALKSYKCDRAMVITNSTYSRPARLLADSNDCILIDNTELTRWILKYTRG
jgi:restriction system protein